MRLPKYLAVFIKGMAMGAADVVPGISGGTVAFIVGIYEELLNSIKAVNPVTAKILFKEGPAAFWQAINGNFLLSLVAGIVTSFLLLAHAITWLIQHYPILLWAFMFGLVFASTIHIGKMITERSVLVVLLFIAGFALSFGITEMKPASIEPTYPIIFGAGAIAITAMILPGISGSFILLLLGLYAYMMGAIKSFDLPVIAVFIAGCLTGILSFVHFLSWLLKNYHNQAISFLTGMLLASLNALWPWKKTVEFYQSSSGQLKPLLQKNISPSQYELLTGQDAMLMASIGLFVFGLALVLILEKMTQDKT